MGKNLFKLFDQKQNFYFIPHKKKQQQEKKIFYTMLGNLKCDDVSTALLGHCRCMPCNVRVFIGVRHEKTLYNLQKECVCVLYLGFK